VVQGALGRSWSSARKRELGQRLPSSAQGFLLGEGKAVFVGVMEESGRRRQPCLLDTSSQWERHSPFPISEKRGPETERVGVATAQAALE
jgi:hypothetical protein